MIKSYPYECIDLDGFKKKEFYRELSCPWNLPLKKEKSFLCIFDGKQISSLYG